MGLLAAAPRIARASARRLPRRASPVRVREDSYWNQRRGPMAMGAAGLDPRLADLPVMMGLGAGAGALAIPTVLNRLAFVHDALSAPEYYMAREEERRLREALRRQQAMQSSYLAGLEIEDARLGREVRDFDTYEGQWGAYGR